MSEAIARPRQSDRQVSNGAGPVPEPGATRALWDAKEREARHLERLTAQAMALELSQDPDELLRIADGDRATIVMVLERLTASAVSRDTAEGLPTLTAAQLLAEERPTTAGGLVGELIPFLAGVAVLAGPRKSFKTLMALLVAIAVAGDRPGVLGRPVGRHGPVLVVLEEGSRSKIRERLELMLAGLDMPEPPGGIHLALFNGLQVDVGTSWEQLQATVAALRPVLVIFDPLVYLHGGDENDNPHMSRVMRRFVQLANDHELVALVLHHLAKPSERRPSRPSDRIRGAGAIAGAGDANLVLDRNGAIGARLQGEFRDAEDVDLYLELDPERLLLVESTAPASQRKVKPEDVAAYVVERGVPIGVSDGAKAWNVARNTALGYLLEATEAGLIDHYLDGRQTHRFIALEPVNAAD